MSKNSTYTKEELQKIVNDEIKSFIKSELENEVKKLIAKSNGNVRNEINDLVKNGLSKLAEFLWVRKGVWQSDIR